MKAKHYPAGFAEKPCLRHLTNKNLQTKANPQGKTGFRCTKVEGHKKGPKDPLGDICASIGTGTLFSDMRIDLRGMPADKQADYMGTLTDKGGTVHCAQNKKKPKD